MSNRRRLILFAVLALGAGAATAAPIVDPVVDGNTAAAAGDHAAAATAFERSISRDGWAAGTLFDLGNAYAGANQPGRAILAYERALILAPHDAAIAANLARVRETAGVVAPEPSRLERAVATLDSDAWSWIALAGGVLACCGLVGRAWGYRRGLARSALLAGALVAVGAGAAAIYVAVPGDSAVITTTNIARISPFAQAEAAFTAPAGETVQIQRRHGDFVYVRDGDRSGWLPRTTVERVIPHDRRTSGA
ncbi:MAG TPA: tetratricopeptide repeat protein [Kofleriaceae bacterium]|jgi:tetratricopeptide (TPR) repeat protein